MKRYVDGYVLPVPKRKLKAYRKLAEKVGKVWVQCGALQYVECVGEDLKSAAAMGCVPFLKMAKTRPNETVVFAYIVYKSRAHRDRVNAKVMKDPWMQKECMGDKSMPFDVKRMAFGGFETIVNKRK